MAEYTWKNLIYNPTLEEAKNAVGKECYFGATPIGCIKNANDDKNSSVLREVRSNEFSPFITSNYGSYSCIIVKEEQKPKYVPFESAQEFLDEYYKSETGRINDGLEHYLSTRGLWLWDKNDEAYKMISEIWNGGVIIGDMKVWPALANQASPTFNNIKTWKKLTEEYEFLDGSPCGRLVEEKYK